MFDNKKEIKRYIKDPKNWKVVDFTKFVSVRNLKDTPIYKIYAHDTKQNEICLGIFMSDNGMLLQNRALTEKELINYLYYTEEEIL